MEHVTRARLAAAVIVALASSAALANTSTTTDAKSGVAHQPANVTAAQDFQDKHDNAVDANATDKQKVAKTKKAKRKIAQRDTTKDATPR
jgi:hypothetical protein